MPKLIKNAKENILREAKNLILTEGISNLNMRAIAERSGVAAGTLYNYFPSKEHLIASIMLEDWMEELASTNRRIASAETAIDGLEIIFNAIRNFSSRNRASWQSYQNRREYLLIREKYHKMLIDQLSDSVCLLGERFRFLFDETVAPFIAEVLLTGGAYPDGKFCFLVPCMKKIVEAH